jgi:hypothetical protein
MEEQGYFVDRLSFWVIAPPPFPTRTGALTITEDHSHEWICDFYYKDGISAKRYNLYSPIDVLPPSEVGPLQLDELQKFKVFAGGDKWDVEIEKFGSRVRRGVTQSTFSQTRMHGWCPWGDPLSAHPYHYQVNPPAPYPYVPCVPKKSN